MKLLKCVKKVISGGQVYTFRQMGAQELAEPLEPRRKGRSFPYTWGMQAINPRRSSFHTIRSEGYNGTGIDLSVQQSHQDLAQHLSLSASVFHSGTRERLILMLAGLNHSIFQLIHTSTVVMCRSGQ